MNIVTTYKEELKNLIEANKTLRRLGFPDIPGMTEEHLIMELQELCDHDNSIDVGDEDHVLMQCPDCGLNGRLGENMNFTAMERNSDKEIARLEGLPF